MLVPRPQPAGFGAQPPRDEELLDWARQVMDSVVAPSGQPGDGQKKETGT
jgi:transcription-repair coupling factor (superfamily II helicase)